MRDNGPAIAWFKDPAGNILSVIQNEPSSRALCRIYGSRVSRITAISRSVWVSYLPYWGVAATIRAQAA